jgi:hypothetical protein
MDQGASQVRNIAAAIPHGEGAQSAENSPAANS